MSEEIHIRAMRDFKSAHRRDPDNDEFYNGFINYIDTNKSFITKNILLELTIHLLCSICRIKGWTGYSNKPKNVLADLVLHNLREQEVVENNIEQEPVVQVQEPPPDFNERLIEREINRQTREILTIVCAHLGLPERFNVNLRSILKVSLVAFIVDRIRNNDITLNQFRSAVTAVLHNRERDREGRNRSRRRRRSVDNNHQEAIPDPELSRILNLARINGINGEMFTISELYYLLGEKTPTKCTIYLNSSFKGRIYGILTAYEKNDINRLIQFKEIPTDRLANFVNFHTLNMMTSSSYAYTDIAILLWNADIVIDSDLMFVPVSNLKILKTLPGSEERRKLAPSNLHDAFLIPKWDTNKTVEVFNDEDSYVVDFKPLSIQRALALYHVGTFDSWETFTRLIYSKGVDKRPHKINDFIEGKQYSIQELTSIALKEGVSFRKSKDINYLTNKIRNNMAKPTFVLSPSLDLALNKQSSYFNDFEEEIPREQIYAYGLRDGSKMKFYERDELMMHFRTNKCFTDPITNTEFRIESIKRLLVLLRNDTSEDGILFQRELNMLIKDQTEKDEQKEDIVKHFKSFKPEIKEGVISCLKILFETGMYCRRWDGKGPYPITAEQTLKNIPSEQIQETVGVQLIRFTEEVQKLGKEESKWFMKLPLKYFKGNTFTTSNSNTDGLTIGDRVKIVMKGKAVSACLRMSSSWFIFSSMFWSYNFIGTSFNIDPMSLEGIA